MELPISMEVILDRFASSSTTSDLRDLLLWALNHFFPAELFTLNRLAAGFSGS